jgi:hypothetical protein
MSKGIREAPGKALIGELAAASGDRPEGAFGARARTWREPENIPLYSCHLSQFATCPSAPASGAGTRAARCWAETSTQL